MAAVSPTCPGLEALVGAKPASVPDLLRARVAATPELPFLRWGERVWSYADALGECERFAGFLRRRGLAGKRVAGYTNNRPEAVWTWFGTQLAGGTYIPLNRSHRGPLLEDMLRRSGARVLVTEADALSEQTGLATLASDARIVVGDAGAPDDNHAIPYGEVAASDRWGGRTPDAGEIGMVMYTSGSTGRSKAVLLTHNQHTRGAGHISSSFGMRHDDVWHGWAPLYHVFGQLYVVLASVVAGGSIALRERFTVSGFWREIGECGATLIGALANMMRLIWALPDDEHSRDNPARLAMAMGQFADLHRAFEQRYGVTLIDCYGLTEAEPLTLPVFGGPPGTHGRPSPDFELAILDDSDRPLPAGRRGRIAARPRTADVLFSGYEGDAERTVAAWRNLWFHTGDVGFVDETGTLHYLGRDSDAIRRRGENVSAHELEEIAQRCPGVLAAAAVGVPGSGDEDEVKLVVACDPAASLTAAELHAFCVREMAAFMVPRYIVIAAELPTLDVGKIDKRALREDNNDAWDAERERVDA